MGDRSEQLPRSRHRRGRADEAGSAMVEFAFVAPLLFMLLFGMFSGGLAYNRKLAVTNGVREGSRYGATLAVAQARAQSTPACAAATTDIDCWLTQVATITEQGAEDELGSTASGSRICVAYAHPDGTTTNDRNRSLVRTAGAGDTFSSGPSATCFTDGRPSSERRVQVSAQRDGELEFLVSSIGLTLNSRSVTRFESLPS